MEANPDSIRAYGTYLAAEAAYNLPTIEKYAIDYGLKTDNVGGAAGLLLKPLGEAIKDVAQPAVEQVFDKIGFGMADLGDAMIDVADNIQGRDETNASLFDQFHLDDEKPGDSHGRDYYGKDGKSAFQIAEVALQPPEAAEGGDKDLTQHLRGPAKEAASIADWFLEAWYELSNQFGLPKIGEGDPPTFETVVLDPLLGDFNELTKNGNAWKAVLADGFAAIVIQMSKNFHTLVDSHLWTGEAAAAAQGFIQHHWSEMVKGAAEQIGEFIASAFKKIAEVLAQLAARLVNAIGEVLNDILVNLIAKHITRGQLGTIWETAKAVVDTFLEFFGIDIDDNTIVDVIERIARVIGDIFEAYETMKELVGQAKEIFSLFNDLKGALEKIPEIKVVKNAGEFAREVKEITTEVQNSDAFKKLQKGSEVYEKYEGDYKEAKERADRLKEGMPEDNPLPEEEKPKKEDYTPVQGPVLNEDDRPYIKNDGSGEVKYGRDFK